MKPKLCHVVFEEYPKDSRVRRYVNTHLREGGEVSIVCSKGKHPSFVERKGHLTIYRIPVTKRRSSFGRRLAEYIVFEIFSFLVVSYLALVRRHRIFHVHTLPDVLVFSCLLPKLLGGKVVLDFHELFPEFMQQHLGMASSDPLVVRVLKLLERASAAFASEVIAIHDPAKNILEERVHPRRPITVIMNGVDETELPIVNRHNDGKFRIVYNGTINYNLNLSIVIRALERLRSTRDDVYQKGEFHLYGDGPDLKNILDLASRLQLRNVLYHGQYQFDLMMRELASASACILPPKKDVYSDLYYSLKLTEMIYLKIPVIATRLKTYLTYYPEDCITYFESQDLDGLVESICYVHDHPLQAEKRSQRAFAEYQKYAWPVMEKRYIDLLDRLSNKWQG